MTAVRKFPAVNRLAELIRLPGGRTVRRLLHEAEAELETHRASFDGELDQRLAALEQLSAAGADGGREIYDHASAIIDTAGLFGFDDLGAAAYALCDLVDSLGEQGRWDAAAVEVHVEALRLLRSRDCPADERERLLAGLHAVFEKVTALPG